MQTLAPNHINKNNMLGIGVLALVFFACVLPLSLSFLPQLLAIICLPYVWTTISYNGLFIVKRYFLWVVTLPILGLISSLWSVTPHDSFPRSMKILGLLVSYGIFLFFILNLPQAARDFIKRFFYVPLLMAGTYLSIELIFDLPIMHLFMKSGDVLYNWLLNKNVAVFSLLFPLGLCSLYSTHKKIIAAPLFALLGLVLIFTDSQSSWLSIIAMIGAGILIYFSSAFLKIMWVALAAVLVAMPFIAPYLYHHFAVPMGDGLLRYASSSSRLEIWYFVSQKILERPLIGFGMDTTRHIVFDNPGLYHEGNSVLHPHNAALQIWCDFGLFGVVVVSASLAVLVRWVLQQDRSFQILCGLLMSGLAVFLLVSWSLWASWLLGLMFFMVAIVPIFSHIQPSKNLNE